MVCGAILVLPCMGIGWGIGSPPYKVAGRLVWWGKDTKGVCLAAWLLKGMSSNQ